MAEETIVVLVDDGDVDRAIFKLERAKKSTKTMQTQAIILQSQVNRLQTIPLLQGTEFEETRRGLKEILKGIPTLTRAQRLIATQVPMMREALMLTYRAKMMAGAMPAVSSIVILIYVLKALKALERIQMQMIREMGSYEEMIRQGLDISHAEYMALDQEVKGYATPWQEFMSKWEAGEYFDAIADFIITKLRLGSVVRGGYGKTLPAEMQRGDWIKYFFGGTRNDTGYNYDWNWGDGPAE